MPRFMARRTDANDLNLYTVEILDNILEVSQQMSPASESVPQIAVPDLCTSFTSDNSLATQPPLSTNTTVTNSKKKKCESNIQMAAAITKMAENDEKRRLVDEQLVNLLSAKISKLN
ncbi:hypothetical protein ACI65C_005288 [Semiaphis heraclei]